METPRKQITFIHVTKYLRLICNDLIRLAAWLRKNEILYDRQLKGLKNTFTMKRVAFLQCFDPDTTNSFIFGSCSMP